jgi:hypothetical protein
MAMALYIYSFLAVLTKVGEAVLVRIHSIAQITMMNPSCVNTSRDDVCNTCTVLSCLAIISMKYSTDSRGVQYCTSYMYYTYYL